VESVYTASLLITIPLVLALLAAITLRNASAGTRALIWRATVVSLLLIFVGRALPSSWMAWVVPDALSTPLVMLGRIQVASLGDAAVSSGPAGADLSAWPLDSALIISLFLLYMAGVLLVVTRTARAWLATRRRSRFATGIHDPSWTALLHEARATLGLRRTVTLLRTGDECTPATWGLVRPVVLLPPSVFALSPARRRALLLHELAHVKTFDWAFGIAARLACALYWFHPAVWFTARTLRAECEVASDDRVLDAGVLPSEYADLLIQMADRVLGGRNLAGFASTFSRRSGLRGRLITLLQPGRNIRAPGLSALMASALITLAVALPAGTVTLAPGRDVLNGLMRDARWESRAYAVRGLAQRPDSVQVAEYAALRDPNPQVRATARAALRGRAPSAPPRPSGRNSGAPL
jgi:beta-lactamase regulating signal transducer with metallopeptidase domain